MNIDRFRLLLETRDQKRALEREMRKHGVPPKELGAFRIITGFDPSGLSYEPGEGVYIVSSDVNIGGPPRVAKHIADYDAAYRYLSMKVAPELLQLTMRGDDAAVLVVEAVTDHVWYLVMRRMPRGDVLVMFEHLTYDQFHKERLEFSVWHTPCTTQGIQQAINELLRALRDRFHRLEQGAE